MAHYVMKSKEQGSVPIGIYYGSIAGYTAYSAAHSGGPSHGKGTQVID